MKTYYDVRNITTGEVIHNLDAAQVGELLGISLITARQYARMYGAYREYEIITLDAVSKNPSKAFNASLQKEWDRYVPKLNKRLKELKVNIPVTEG